jgi:acyl carrier protein
MQKFIELATKILAEQMDMEPEEIGLDATFEDMGADSIDIVEMIMALEDIYDVEFPEEDLEAYPTFGDLLKALYSYIEKVKNE